MYIVGADTTNTTILIHDVKSSMAADFKPTIFHTLFSTDQWQKHKINKIN